ALDASRRSRWSAPGPHPWLERPELSWFLRPEDFSTSSSLTGVLARTLLPSSQDRYSRVSHPARWFRSNFRLYIVEITTTTRGTTDAATRDHTVVRRSLMFKLGLRTCVVLAGVLLTSSGCARWEDEGSSADEANLTGHDGGGPAEVGVP